MRIAIVGTGISGLVCAHLLHRDHDLVVYEAEDRLGGHTHTVDVDGLAIDTGFIVYNDWTYPNFIRLLRQLGVDTQPSTMSFSVKCEKTGLEYNGTSLNTLFAQRRNLVRLSFLRMIRDIFRFNRTSVELLSGNDDGTTLGEYLTRNGYSRPFVEHYIVPMGSSVWSTDPARFLGFPARTFVEFFQNHGMLSVNRRPQWRVVAGGSRRYVEALVRPFREKIRLSCPVERVRRLPGGAVEVSARGATERFDHLIFATHSDQALRLLQDPSAAEREILGALPYQANDAVLHCDESLLPRRRRAWASWNYHILRESSKVAVTYNMNILQSLDTARQYLVTLNRHDDIDPALVLRRMTWHHPVYTPAGMAARLRWPEISGVAGTHYCGAYWSYGFHEDGVRSALRVCERFGRRL